MSKKGRGRERDFIDAGGLLKCRYKESNIV
jgi:hypothetical protein